MSQTPSLDLVREFLSSVLKWASNEDALTACCDLTPVENYFQVGDKFVAAAQDCWKDAHEAQNSGAVPAHNLTDVEVNGDPATTFALRHLL